MFFMGCTWKPVGILAYKVDCVDQIACQNFLGAFPIKYCPSCGRKIKLVEE